MSMFCVGIINQRGWKKDKRKDNLQSDLGSAGHGLLLPVIEYLTCNSHFLTRISSGPDRSPKLVYHTVLYCKLGLCPFPSLAPFVSRFLPFSAGPKHLRNLPCLL